MQTKIKGIVLCFLLAIPAFFLGRQFPIVGGPVFGILLGLIFAYWKRPAAFNDGISFTSKKILQYAIILLGFGMNLFQVFKVGGQSLIIMIFTLAASFLTAYFMGKVLKLKGNVPILIGVGTSICGGSAIAATAPVIKASDKDMAFSISTIFLFNVVAVFIFPALGHAMGMDDMNFGMWAGTAINDTSSVVAAGYAFSDAAGDYATIVKLTRTLMIIPITLVLAVYMTRKAKKGLGESGEYSIKKIFPWFIVLFLGMVGLRSLGLITPQVGDVFSQISKFLMVMALGAIGLKTDFRQVAKSGFLPMVHGFLISTIVIVVSFLVQLLLGQM